MLKLSQAMIKDDINVENSFGVISTIFEPKMIVERDEKNRLCSSKNRTKFQYNPEREKGTTFSFSS